MRVLLGVFGLGCTLALSLEEPCAKGGRGSDALEVEVLDDALLLVQSIPLADQTSALLDQPFLRQTGSRYLATRKRVARRRRSRRRLAPDGLNGTAEEPKPQEWWDAKAKELRQIVEFVPTGNESAEWWSARARELDEARKELRRLAWRRGKDERLREAALQRERQRARRAEYEAEEAERKARKAQEIEKLRQRDMRVQQLAKWKEEDDEAVGEILGQPLNLTARDEAGTEIHFLFRDSIPLKVLAKFIGKRTGIRLGTANVTFRGKQLDPKVTADAIGLRDADVIEVSGRFQNDGGESSSGAALVTDAEGAKSQDKLHLIVKTPEGREVRVTMLSTARLQLMMGLTCRRLRLEEHEVRFLYNGTKLVPGDTPQHAGLADGDTVQVEPDFGHFEAIQRAKEEAQERAEQVAAQHQEQVEARRQIREKEERRAEESAERKVAAEAQKAAIAARKEAMLKAHEEAQQYKRELAKQKAAEEKVRVKREAEKEEVKRAVYGDLIHLIVKDEHGRELHVKFRMRSRLRALMAAICKQWGLASAHMELTHAGKTINARDTPEAMNMKDMDVIQVSMVQEAVSHLTAGRAARATTRPFRRTSKTGKGKPSTDSDVRGARKRGSRFTPGRRARAEAKYARDSKVLEEEAHEWIVIEPDMDLNGDVQENWVP